MQGRPWLQRVKEKSLESRLVHLGEFQLFLHRAAVMDEQRASRSADSKSYSTAKTCVQVLISQSCHKWQACHDVARAFYVSQRKGHK